MEIIIGTIIPIYLLGFGNYRNDKKWLFITSIFVLSGFILNRLNVCVTGLIKSSGYNYFPSFDEISITLMLVVFAVIAFRTVAKYFPVFESDHDTEELGNRGTNIIQNN